MKNTLLSGFLLLALSAVSRADSKCCITFSDTDDCSKVVKTVCNPVVGFDSGCQSFQGYKRVVAAQSDPDRQIFMDAGGNNMCGANNPEYQQGECADISGLDTAYIDWNCV